jgi:hypothetical protein
VWRTRLAASAGGNIAKILFVSITYIIWCAWRAEKIPAISITCFVGLIFETHAPDDAYEELRKHFSEVEAVNLTILIGTINAWNRLAISFRAAPPAKAKAATAA